MKNRLIFLLFLFLCSPFLYAQDNVASIDSIAASLIKSLRANSSEKIYLQTDKQIYGAGEKLWFKALNTDSINKKLTNRNKILYADLVNEKDSIVSKILLNASTLETNGAFQLHDSLQQGYYWLRVYGEEQPEKSIAISPVFVFNKASEANKNLLPSPVNRETVIKMNGISASVYPEGGALISGTNSVVVLQFRDNESMPLATTGIIRDQSGKPATDFKSGKEGFARIEFTPKWFNTYSVWIKNGDRFDSVAALPKVNFYAAQLAVTEQNENYAKLRVMMEDSLFKPGYTTYVIGLVNDSLCFAGVGREMYELNMPLAAFPNGIARLLLFNTSKKLLSERDIYVDRNNMIAKISTDKNVYAARENVQLEISVTDANGKPLPAALSLAVTDERVSDSLNHFFEDPYASYDKELRDMVMIASSNHQPFAGLAAQVEKSAEHAEALKVGGRVLNKKNGPMPDMQVLIVSNENTVFYLQDTTDSKGHFTFDMPDFYDSSKFNLQVNNLKGEKEDYDIVLDRVEWPIFTTPVWLKEKSLVSLRTAVERAKENHFESLIEAATTLPPVTVTADVQKKKAKKSDGPGLITQEMLKRGGANNVGEAVLRSGKFHLLKGYLMAGGPNGFDPSPFDEPTVFLDGVQISIGSGNSDPTESSPVLGYLKTLSTSEIDYIKLMTGTEAGIYGVRSGHGVIEIHTTTKGSNLPNFTGLQAIFPQGFYMPQPFTTPDYKNADKKYSKFPDTRTTIYWNGDLFTDADGKVKINFFTADAPTQYVVKIFGVTAGGNLVFKTAIINRK